LPARLNLSAAKADTLRLNAGGDKANCPQNNGKKPSLKKVLFFTFDLQKFSVAGQ
jgi:hypothetical protein